MPLLMVDKRPHPNVVNRFLPWVSLSFKTSSIPAIMDAGAAVSVLKSECVPFLTKLGVVKREIAASDYCNVANGHVVHLNKLIICRLKLNHYSWDCGFRIIDNLRQRLCRRGSDYNFIPGRKHTPLGLIPVKNGFLITGLDPRNCL
jgi:hypothetical protein